MAKISMMDFVTAKQRRIDFMLSNPTYIQTLKKRIRTWLLLTN